MNELRVSHLEVHYGDLIGVADVSLRVEEGTIVALLGAVILIPLQTVTNSLFGGGGSGLTYILYGGIIVLLARFEPGGMHEWWQRVAPFLARRKHAA